MWHVFSQQSNGGAPSPVQDAVFGLRRWPARWTRAEIAQIFPGPACRNDGPDLPAVAPTPALACPRLKNSRNWRHNKHSETFALLKSRKSFGTFSVRAAFDLKALSAIHVRR